MNPKLDPRAAPGRRLLAALGRGRGRVRALHAQQEALGPALARPAAVPQPRQLRRLGRRAQPLAVRQGRGGRRLHPHRDHAARSCWSRTTRSSACARATRAATSPAGEKGNFEPGSDVMAKATVLAEGCWGHLTGAAQKGLGLAGNDPQVWALGVKEVWEVEQPLEQGHAHARLAAAPAGEVPGVRRLVDLRHEPRGREAEGVDRVRLRARQRRRAALGPRRAAGVQAPPARQEGARGRQARRLGREGDPGGRLLGAPAPARTPAWSSAATRAAWSTCPS